MSLCPHGVRIEHRRCDQCEEIAAAENAAARREFDERTAVPQPRIPPLELDGMRYTPDIIEGLCSDVRDVRDAALKEACFPWAVAMSHVHAVLKHLAAHTSK